MNRSLAMLLLAGGLCLPTGATAQEETARESRLATLLRLPFLAQEAREVGVTEGTIQSVLGNSREHRLPPEETAVILGETTSAVRGYGPVDNFGAFVQEALERGLRGRELANAIQAEHRARGKGPGKDHDRERGKGQGQEKGQGQGQGQEEGQDKGRGQGQENAPEKARGGGR